MGQSQADREERRKAKAARAKHKAEIAVKNGIRVTFSAKPVLGELDFAKALRRSLNER